MTRLICLTVFIGFIVGCASATVNNKHPSLLKQNSSDAAQVYFIRPNQRYSRAGDRAVKIIMDNMPMLELEKGSYILLFLTPGNKNVKVKSFTHYGREERVVEVEENKIFHFRAGQPYFIYLEPYARGYKWGTSYRPKYIDHAVALTKAAALKPIGKARSNPLTYE